MAVIKPKNIPAFPGVYFFSASGGSAFGGKDPSKKILYIGKAANLKNRLGSYWQKPIIDNRLKTMLSQARRVQWQETPSEIEALLLESKLIKKFRPPFNILLRDDKQYFYVVFTKEEFPRLFPTHQPFAYTQNKNLKPITYNLKPDFIGPFTDGKALKTALKLLRRVFPYCTCKKSHWRHCLNYHLGNCPGFCCLRNHETENMKQKTKEYEKNIKVIKKILNGKRTTLVKQLEKEMKTAARKENFPKAIELRNKIEKLNRVFANARIIKEISSREKILAALQKSLRLPALPQRIEAYDIANIQGQFATGAMVVFQDGLPDKSQYRKFKIRLENTPNDPAMIKEVITRRCRHPEWPWPDLVLIDGGRAQLNAANSVISNFKFPRLPEPAAQAAGGQVISKQTQNSKFKAPTIIALTKNSFHRGDHLTLLDQKDLLPLNSLSTTVKNLLLAISEEAHRFAISYYRQRHRKGLTPPLKCLDKK